MLLFDMISKFEQDYFIGIQKKREAGKIVSALNLKEALKILGEHIECADCNRYFQLIMEEYYKNKEYSQKSIWKNDVYLVVFEKELIKFEKIKIKNEKRLLLKEKEAIKAIKEQFANFIKSGAEALAKREKERSKLVNDILTSVYK